MARYYYPNTFRAIVLNYFKAVQEFHDRIINGVREIVEEIQRSITEFVGYAVNVADEIVRNIADVPDETIKCTNSILLAMANMSNEMASSVYANVVDQIYNTAYDERCNRIAWLFTFLGALFTNLKKCPFNNCKRMLKINRAIVNSLSEQLKIPGEVIVQVAYMYCLAKQVAVGIRQLVVLTAYRATGQKEGKDAPPNPQTFANEFYDHTTPEFSEIVDYFNEIIEKYGGRFYPTLEGPPDVKIDGILIRPPYVNIPGAIQDLLEDYVNAVLRSWGLK